MKRVLKSALFKALFTDGMRRLRINAAAGRIDDQAIAELWLAWDNPEWSATPELLATIGRLALRGASGTILECGSGVSTVVMAAAAHSNGSRVIALESDKSWHRHMTQLTVDLKLSNVEIRLAPLVANGAADWYDLAVANDIAHVDLFVCDGPPGSTRGGRSGCLDFVCPRLTPHARVVIDDTNRAPEREVAERFASAFPCTSTNWGRPDHQFALIERI